MWERENLASESVRRSDACTDAYTSSVFAQRRKYAQHFGEQWLVLSAKYGFITPDFVIQSDYNVSFYDAEAISVSALRSQVRAKRLSRFETVGLVGSETYWNRVRDAFEGSAPVLRHVNGNIGFPASFHRLMNDLIANNVPFPDGRV